MIEPHARWVCILWVNMRQPCFTHTHTHNMRPLENCMADFCAMAHLSSLLGKVYSRFGGKHPAVYKRHLILRENPKKRTHKYPGSTTDASNSNEMWTNDLVCITRFQLYVPPSLPPLGFAYDLFKITNSKQNFDSSGYNDMLGFTNWSVRINSKCLSGYYASLNIMSRIDNLAEGKIARKQP